MRLLRFAAALALLIFSTTAHAQMVGTSSTVRAIQQGPWTVSVTGPFWQTTQPVSMVALPLPAGAATSANQATIATNTGRIPAPGSATSATSLPVVIATDQAAVVVSSRNGHIASGAPAASVAVSTVSASATGLTASSCYRVACALTVTFRAGAGAVTAVASDALLFGGTAEKVCLRSTDTVLAFVVASGTTTCTASRLFDVP